MTGHNLPNSSLAKRRHHNIKQLSKTTIEKLISIDENEQACKERCSYMHKFQLTALWDSIDFPMINSAKYPQNLCYLFTQPNVNLKTNTNLVIIFSLHHFF